MTPLAPGMYPGLPFEEYLAQPAVSAGLLADVVEQCPAAAWFGSWLNPEREPQHSKIADAGSIAHGILLEGSTERVEIFDPSDFANATGGGCATGWTNKAIRDARDAARAAGKIPVLKDDFATIEAMVRGARRFIDQLKNSEPAVWTAFQEGCGVSEAACLWDDDGLLCRMRPDRMSDDRGVIIDLKFSTVSVEPAAWSRAQMTPQGYWLRAAWYRRGAQQMFGTEPAYFFLVVSQKAPHLCSLVGVDPAGFEHGGLQLERGLRTWRDCVEREYWPGYPARACYPEVKPWDAALELERAGLDRDGIPYDLDQMFERKAA